MHFGIICGTLAAFAASVFAGGYEACMSDADAQQVVTNFQTLIAAYSDELAEAALTVDFIDYSDSVNELINEGCSGPQALGSPTFATRAEFEAGQGAQPPIPFDVLNTWNNCDSVTIRWRSSIAAGAPQFVTGIIVLETVQAPAGSTYPWLINTVYSEFNSGAWLVDLGIFVPTCNGTTKRVRRSRYA